MILGFDGAAMAGNAPASPPANVALCCKNRLLLKEELIACSFRRERGVWRRWPVSNKIMM
jgi:hypothetical protein